MVPLVGRIRWEDWSDCWLEQSTEQRGALRLLVDHWLGQSLADQAGTSVRAAVTPDGELCGPETRQQTVPSDKFSFKARPRTKSAATAVIDHHELRQPLTAPLERPNQWQIGS